MKISLIGFVMAALILAPVFAHADDAAATGVAASVSTDTGVAVETVPAAAVPAAVEDVEPGEAAVESLDFASGEIVSYAADSGNLDVKVYLDAEGNASEQTLTVKVDPQTEITSGDEPLKTDALVKGAEVDVEYDTQTKKATYIFIY